jgi:hypothetical protein
MRKIIVAFALVAGLGLNAGSAKADWISDIQSIVQSLTQSGCSDCEESQIASIFQQ